MGLHECRETQRETEWPFYCGARRSCRSARTMSGMLSLCCQWCAWPFASWGPPRSVFRACHFCCNAHGMLNIKLRKERCHKTVVLCTIPLFKHGGGLDCCKTGMLWTLLQRPVLGHRFSLPLSLSSVSWCCCWEQQPLRTLLCLTKRPLPNL